VLPSTKLCRDCGINPAALGRADCLSCRRIPDAEDRAENPYRLLLNGARKRGVECTITEEEYEKLVESGKCFYCRRPLGSSGHRLDRKDSNGDYTVENCVPCCWTCNRAKGASISFENFRRMQFPIYAEMQGEELRAEISASGATNGKEFYAWKEAQV
jgi:5-methylcytosine-specific restriction endonuclease McrA